MKYSFWEVARPALSSHVYEIFSDITQECSVMIGWKLLANICVPLFFLNRQITPTVRLKQEAQRSSSAATGRAKSSFHYCDKCCHQDPWEEVDLFKGNLTKNVLYKGLLGRGQTSKVKPIIWKAQVKRSFQSDFGLLLDACFPRLF